MTMLSQLESLLEAARRVRRNGSEKAKVEADYLHDSPELPLDVLAFLNAGPFNFSWARRYVDGSESSFVHTICIEL